MTLRVAFQGEKGAFSEEAVLRFFGDPVAPVPCRTLSDVFRAVASGDVERAVAALENSQAGSINATYDLLRQFDLYVVGEEYLPVSQCLLGPRGTSVSEIRRVYSHPAALDQCMEFIESLRAEAVAVYDTAGSARMLAGSKEKGAAAIASARAGEIYGLDVLARDVQTVRENITRFVVLAREPVPRSPGPQKTAIVMVTDNRPGALYRALGALAKQNVNLMKLESRPSRSRPWEYVFYLDLEGHREDATVRAGLAELSTLTTFLKVLGSFPRAKER